MLENELIGLDQCYSTGEPSQVFMFAANFYKIFAYSHVVVGNRHLLLIIESLTSTCNMLFSYACIIIRQVL